MPQHPDLKSTVQFYIIGGAIYETEKSQYSRSGLQQLAAAIEDLIANPATRLAMGKAGRDTAIARFALDRLGTDILLVYHNIIRSQSQ